MASELATRWLTSLSSSSARSRASRDLPLRLLAGAPQPLLRERGINRLEQFAEMALHILPDIIDSAGLQARPQRRGRPPSR